MLRIRFLFGSLLTALLLAVFYLDYRFQASYGFIAVLAVFTALCANESLRLLQRNSAPAGRFFVIAAALAIVLAEWVKQTMRTPVAPRWLDPAQAGSHLVFLMAVFGLLLVPIAAGRVERVQTAVFGVFVLVYVAVFFTFLVKLRGMTYCRQSVGLQLVLLVIATCKMTDTGAFVIGRTLGKRKLAPVISPNKTVAGFVGGLFIGTGAGVALWKLLALPREVPLLPLVVAIAAVSVFAQIGDLVESALKRYAGVKDSGTTLWAFGGALDMADSVLFAAPVSYLAFALLLRL